MVKAQEMGVFPGPAYGALKAGESVQIAGMQFHCVYKVVFILLRRARYTDFAMPLSCSCHITMP